jgi:hypothetical protein
MTKGHLEQCSILTPDWAYHRSVLLKLYIYGYLNLVAMPCRSGSIQKLAQGIASSDRPYAPGDGRLAEVARAAGIHTSQLFR